MVGTSMVRVLALFCVLWVLADTTYIPDQRSDFHDAWKAKHTYIYAPDPVKMEKVNSMTNDQVREELEKTKSTKEHPLYKAPLDVVFLIANTEFFHSSAINALFMDKLDVLQTEFPGSRFGMSFFTDFVRTDRLSGENLTDEYMPLWYHDDPEGCYKKNTILSSDISKLQANAKSIPLAIAENHIAGMAGILMAAEDKNLGWNTENRNRIIFVVSNLPTTCCKKPFGIKNKPKGDGTDTCMTMDDPEPEFVGKILREKKISLFFILEGVSQHIDMNYNNIIPWSDLCIRMNVPFGIADIDIMHNIDPLKNLNQFRDYILRVSYAD